MEQKVGDTYSYCKQWLSRADLFKIRKDANLTRQQVHNIMKGKSKNFPVLTKIVSIAKANEEATTLNS